MNNFKWLAIKRNFVDVLELTRKIIIFEPTYSMSSGDTNSSILIRQKEYRLARTFVRLTYL